MWNKGLVLRKGWGLSGLGPLTLNKGLKGQNASEMRGLGHIYIYIYIYAVKLKAGPRFGGSKVKTGPSLKLQTGPSFSLFSPFFIVFLGIFENTNTVTLCQNSVSAKFWGCQNEVFEKKIAFFVCLFYVEK